MKTTILILTLALSTQAFANTKDLKIFNALIAAGARVEGGMSQLHVGVDNVGCTNALCYLQDISNQGTTLTIEGQAAYDLIDALEVGEPPEMDPYGKYEVQFDSIRCHQVQEGVAEGTEAERTTCQTDPGLN